MSEDTNEAISWLIYVALAILTAILLDHAGRTATMRMRV